MPNLKKEQPKSVEIAQPTDSFKNARRLIHFLSRHRKNIPNILVMVHDFPDPDAIASAYTLQYIAEKKFGIESRIVFGGVIGRTENRAMVDILKIRLHKIRPVDFKKYANIVLVDTQPGFGNNSFPQNGKATIVIDQHEPLSEKVQAKLSIIDTGCGATCVILTQALLLLNIEIPKRIATALAYGILSDTMNLYRADRSDVIQTYLDILHYSDLRALAKIQNPERSRSFFSTLARSIQGAMFCRGLIVSHLKNVVNPDLVSLVADFLQAYRGIKWVFCTGRYKGTLYISFRTTNLNVDAGEILRDIFIRRGKAGGSGTMAGGRFEVGTDVSESVWEEVEVSFVERLRRRIRIPARADFYFPFRNR
ncbi:MAG: hypothetical protein A3G33_03025 [Omnitrophica bacterium RIFCSPLOWO2_12_FULL_44_17]|uniref:DDH domain-containing protein n=1 Tax=Candidatus Danuiimicrobium aquiferis TaxID=1801832 RepID=A0A1G1KVZ5_9BACT|nr:MAG: hypothetical protein A3B72_04505 [Omnitrophica bacterium RIFCSPHIGHO2_02_FULL_45_28]OGW96952.1 MAG: hypothetical protein A3G33_03025 [Omnitrophica bacterium RIFCSPLOWO2_12_FULL_44_17]OGX03913.1 MAG: hypothetical protein A3J12_03390 [Omnitrophica bacterium RIFCSPLOWO2_02_FULL_44_11]